jgi:hypothetical protein
VETIYRDQWEYTEISHLSSQPSTRDRISHLRTLKMDYNSILPVVEKYKELIDNKYDIPTKDELISALR